MGLTLEEQQPPGEEEIAGQDQPEGTWHALDIDRAAEKLGTDTGEGLSQKEAQTRLESYGYNELREAPRPGFWQMLLDQFNNFIIIFLIVAAILSALLGDHVEAIAIMAIVILNAILGVVQERRAEEALAALKRMAAPEAHVVRDGHRETVPARELVPGDVVHLEAGNFVPADLRLIESVNLRIEEAALTGESVPVEKESDQTLEPEATLGDRHNIAFSGTTVAHGRGRGVVVATGMNTEIGKIATMLQSMEVEETPLQQRLDDLGKTLGWAALAICGMVFLIGGLRGFDWVEMFVVAVSLAVAAVPEGLPAVVTITLALGMRKMVERNALIRRLASVETLGSTTVICSDKTGTLTENQMTVTRMWVDGHDIEVTGASQIPEGDFRREGEPIELEQFPAVTTALWVAALDNDAVIEENPENETERYRTVGDPTEAALVIAAAKAGAWRENLERGYPRVDEIPFDSTRKRMTTIHRVEGPDPADPSPFYDEDSRGWEVAAVKGAPDVILELCSRYQRLDDEVEPLSEEQAQRIKDANEAMTEDALRVLAVAYKLEEELPRGEQSEAVEADLVFVGLIGMIDPPRAEVPDAIATARRAGVRTMMITGDYPVTARAIAQDIGLLGEGGEVTTGAQLQTMSDDELFERVVDTDVYARVSPEHKVRIVEALRKHRHVVAMTGDGVNDAPALKRSDIGVAMGITGTDVAKETADMVLTDDNYVSIVSAIEQGRIIYANIRKFVFYLLSSNLAEIAVIFLAIAAGAESPLTPIQILWLNLVTDGAPALALGVEPGDPDTMKQPPRPTDESIINRLMRFHISVQTVAKTASTLFAYWVGLQLYPNDVLIAKTMAFATLTFAELLRAFTSRSERYHIWNIGFFSNRAMIWAVLSSLVLSLAVVYIPFLQPIFDTVSLGWAEWRIILPLLFVPPIAHEIAKWVVARWDIVEARPSAETG